MSGWRHVLATILVVPVAGGCGGAGDAERTTRSTDTTASRPPLTVTDAARLDDVPNDRPVRFEAAVQRHLTTGPGPDSWRLRLRPPRLLDDAGVPLVDEPGTVVVAWSDEPPAGPLVQVEATVGRGEDVTDSLEGIPGNEEAPEVTVSRFVARPFGPALDAPILRATEPVARTTGGSTISVRAVAVRRTTAIAEVVVTRVEEEDHCTSLALELLDAAGTSSADVATLQGATLGLGPRGALEATLRPPSGTRVGESAAGWIVGDASAGDWREALVTCSTDQGAYELRVPLSSPGGGGSTSPR